ncbi:MAG: ABC transporter ATP-binding protein [Phycisphaerae bacterium]|nr:ABC transporter ATP-binding protein [Phycisphaerae bacterium]
MNGNNHDGPILTARGVEFAYPTGKPALRGIDITAERGQFVCLLGPNGCGKTTLLRCLMGRLKPQGGEILLDGRDVCKFPPRQLARRLAYVPQQPSCAFAMPVRDIVLTGRLAHAGTLGLAGREDIETAEVAMKITETLEFGSRALSELSGGEAQRVMIARALAQRPSLCLLDEPTSNLDIRHQMQIYRMLHKLAHEWSMAVVCVSHDINLAGRFADRLVLMRAGQVIADGTAAEVIVESTLARTYDVKVDLIPVEGSVPVVRAK